MNSTQKRQAKKDEIYEDALLELYIGMRRQIDSDVKRQQEKKFDQTVSKVKNILKKDKNASKHSLLSEEESNTLNDNESEKNDSVR